MTLRLGQLNTQGLASTFQSFQQSLLRLQLDIVLLSELKTSSFYSLSSLSQLPLLPGYTLHYESARCGFIYRDNLGCRPLNLNLDSATGTNNSSQHVHATGLLVPNYSAGSPLLLLSIYRPPTAPLDALDEFFNSINPVLSQYNYILIGGDFNCHHQDWGDVRTCRVGRFFSDFIELYLFFFSKTAI